MLESIKNIQECKVIIWGKITSKVWNHRFLSKQCLPWKLEKNIWKHPWWKEFVISTNLNTIHSERNSRGMKQETASTIHLTRGTLISISLRSYCLVITVGKQKHQENMMQKLPSFISVFIVNLRMGYLGEKTRFR